MKDAKKTYSFLCCSIICLLFTWDSFARIMPATKSPPTMSERIEQAGNKFTKPAIEVISVKDHPNLVSDDGNFLENITIVYEPLNDKSYSWKKVPLNWNENYGDTVIAHDSNVSNDDINVVKLLPFTFPFYKQTLVGIDIRANYKINFGLAIKGKSCGGPILSGCPPSIIALGKDLSIISLRTYYLSGSDYVQVTWIDDVLGESPYDWVKTQIKLYPSGKIEISYLSPSFYSVAHSYMGLYAGTGSKQAVFDLQDDSGNVSVQSDKTSVLFEINALKLNKENFMQEVVKRYPEGYFDYVVILSDFTLVRTLFAGEEAFPTTGPFMGQMYNEILGLGPEMLPTDCTKMNCDLRKHTKAFIIMNNFARFGMTLEPAVNDFYKLLSHEMGHSFVLYTGGDIESKAFPRHWDANVLVSSAYLPEVTSTLSAKDASSNEGYSWQDLYFMGLADTKEMKPFTSPDGTHWSGAGYFQLKLGMGLRVPSYEDSQKMFNVLAVFLTKEDEKGFANKHPDIISWYQDIMGDFVKYFDKITLGRGTITYQKDSPLVSWQTDPKFLTLGAKVKMLLNKWLDKRYKMDESMIRIMDVLCRYANCSPVPPSDPLIRAELISTIMNRVTTVDIETKELLNKEIDDYLFNKVDFIQNRSSNIKRFNDSTKSGGDMGEVFY